ncbi:MAG TPA: beta-N-acetylhexosaminidase, partial [Rhodanobacter sp.]|nr:beta-N-acetylhexosaminidase [Rhodanobacter sp.]
MTRRLLCLPCLCLLTWMSPALAGVHTTPATTPLSLLPMPAQLQRTAGSFIVDAHTPIMVADPSAATRRTAEYLAGLSARTRSLPLSVRPDQLESGQAAPHAIVLRRDPQAPLTNREGYALNVTPAGIHLTARDDAGLFYGAVTLWQLLTPDARQGAVQLPAVQIRDQPRFVWRGLMLDSARHFQSVADIRQLLDWMALHKLNVLHWHLTDDQGWRLQIKRYPELTRIGSCRRAVGPDAALTGSADTPYCGYYTQAQVRELVRYAAARYITIVPEIEMPGHAQAAIAAYPSLGVTGQRPPVSTDWGVHASLYNVDDNTIAFLHNVLDEVLALFPSTYIHIGGDEAVKDQWQASPAIQARMRQLGVSHENALQSWLIRHMEHYLAAHGRKLIGWDEILEGGLPAEATVMSWRGSDGAITAANQGHDVVLSPSPTLYLDNLQSDQHDEPAGRAQVQSLRDIYDFNPLPAAIGVAQAKHVLGVQANLWTEYMPTFARAQHAIFPRLAALAELDWSPAAAHDWPGFLARLPAQFARYRALGIDYADSAFAPQFALTAAAAGNIKVSMT